MPLPMPMMPPPPMLPQSPGAGSPPGLGAALAPMLARLGQSPLPQPPGPPGGNPMDQLMPFLAGSGFQNILAQITKFMKILTTVGTRDDKSVRVPLQGNVGSMDQMAMQLAQARAGMPGPGGLPPQGPANLPVTMRM